MIINEDWSNLGDEFDSEEKLKESSKASLKTVKIPKNLLYYDGDNDFPILDDAFYQKAMDDQDYYIQQAELRNVILTDASGNEYRLTPNEFAIHTYIQNENVEGDEVAEEAKIELAAFLKDNGLGDFGVESGDNDPLCRAGINGETIQGAD